MRKQNIYVEDPTLKKNENTSRPPARSFEQIKAPATLPRNAHNTNRPPAALPKDNNWER
jgi:hypothetical protein